MEIHITDSSDDRANDEADAHYQVMRDQREATVEGKKLPKRLSREVGLFGDFELGTTMWICTDTYDGFYIQASGSSKNEAIAKCTNPEYAEAFQQ